MGNFKNFLIKESRPETNVWVVSGGPGVGKTTVINGLAQKKYPVLPETARLIGEKNPKFQAANRDACEFQSEILKTHEDQIKALKPDELAFSDRGVGDSLAYTRLYCPHYQWKVIEYANGFHYAGVFILDPLPTYAQDAFRRETQQEQSQIHGAIIEAYFDLNYKPIFVPPIGIQERVKFILDSIKQ